MNTPPTHTNILNFHGIGTPNRPFEPGEEPYWISIQQFEEVLGVIANNSNGSVQITFDDGNDSDVLIALPRLQSGGLSARFFVLAGKLGSKGYLRTTDLRLLRDQGMKVGTHGSAHVNWARLNGPDLSSEVDEARQILEKAIDGPINSAAIPFGAYNGRVIRKLKAAGFHNVYTSDGGSFRSNRWLQPRTSIRHDTALPALERLVRLGSTPMETVKRDARMLFKTWR